MTAVKKKTFISYYLELIGKIWGQTGTLLFILLAKKNVDSVFLYFKHTIVTLSIYFLSFSIYILQVNKCNCENIAAKLQQ